MIIVWKHDAIFRMIIISCENVVSVPRNEKWGFSLYSPTLFKATSESAKWLEWRVLTNKWMGINMPCLWSSWKTTLGLMDCQVWSGQLIIVSSFSLQLLEYVGKGKSIIDVGLAQARQPLSTRSHYFEVEIVDPGEKCYIALGLARKVKLWWGKECAVLCA